MYFAGDSHSLFPHIVACSFPLVGTSENELLFGSYILFHIIFFFGGFSFLILFSYLPINSERWLSVVMLMLLLLAIFLNFTKARKIAVCSGDVVEAILPFTYVKYPTVFEHKRLLSF